MKMKNKITVGANTLVFIAIFYGFTILLVALDKPTLAMKYFFAVIIASFVIYFLGYLIKLKEVKKHEG